jgi:shikimate kinase
VTSEDTNEPRSGPGALIALVGASGSGKTVIAERAAKGTGWQPYDTDAQILIRTGATRISDIFDMHGEVYFRGLEIQCLDDIAGLPPRIIVATGGGLPAIPGVMERLNGYGVTVYLKASVGTLWKRLNTDPRQLENRPLLRRDGKETLERLLRERERVYSAATVTLDTDQLSVDEVAALVVTQIRSMDGALG